MRLGPNLTLLALLVARSPGASAGEAPYVPPPAAQVRGYFETLMPCKIVVLEGINYHTVVRCTDDLLARKSLRELSILRNTIYARYGWSGFRKRWLRDHFQGQPWFKPNPRFSYKLISEVDRQNAHFIGTHESSLSGEDLRRMRILVYARHGRRWSDKPSWKLPNGKIVVSCKEPRKAVRVEKDGKVRDGDWEGRAEDYYMSSDCYAEAQPWYKANPAYTDALLSPEDRVEVGLIDMAAGRTSAFFLGRAKAESSLEGLARIEDLRDLSLRDLRILRNTIYARRGRAFKSRTLQSHFERLGWYEIDKDYSDAKLTKTDQRNIALIKSVEDEFGGPLTEDETLIEPYSDGA